MIQFDSPLILSTCVEELVFFKLIKYNAKAMNYEEMQSRVAVILEGFCMFGFSPTTLTIQTHPVKSVSNIMERFVTRLPHKRKAELKTSPNMIQHQLPSKPNC